MQNKTYRDYSGNRDFSTKKTVRTNSSLQKNAKSAKNELEFDSSLSASRRNTRGSSSSARSRSFSDENVYKNAGNSNRPYKKRKSFSRKKQERLITWGLLFVLALVICTVIIVVKSCSTPDEPVVLDPATDRMQENVSVNGIVISGMTIDEARAVVMPTISSEIDKIHITLTGDEFEEEINGEQLGASSNLEEILISALANGKDKSYSTSVTIDYNALNSTIKDINTTLSHGATDATFSLEEDSKGKPQLTYTEGTAGIGLDTVATQSLILEALEKGNFNVSLTPVLTTVEPEITVSDLKSQVSEIGRFSTTFCKKLPSSDPEEDKIIIENRSFNIEKCADIINGEVVNPGKTWSFNKVVGDRDEKGGWKEAKGIYGGETYNMQYGGGVCQVSTTLYNALMRAGIPFSAITRRQHSIPSTYVSKGLDATVDSGHIDFKFKNTTDYPIYIFAYTTPTKNRSRYRDINVVIYGRALPEGTSYELRPVIIEEIAPGEPIITYNKKKMIDFSETTVEARTGYVVDVYLDTYENGKVVNSEMLYEDRYEAITQKITVGTQPLPTATPAPSESGGNNSSSGSSSASPTATPKPEENSVSPVYTENTDDMP